MRPGRRVRSVRWPFGPKRPHPLLVLDLAGSVENSADAGVSASASMVFTGGAGAS
ncbi:hypothetical protein [Dermacoccus nishinomiyaensis]|uniref:hypothetical protein n=1 Tax=Dermacoccus nishinomiyaensis TaxID=1274 RepID=UPI0016432EF0|nr:hypothetical protein [Dermacoccus nishinomiyaensis]